MDRSLISEVSADWALAVPASMTEEELILLLAKRINDLIREDFNQLLSLLYRIDIDERKLKALLQEQPEKDAGVLIAGMILERQKQKMAARAKFRSGQETDQDQEEKW